VAEDFTWRDGERLIRFATGAAAEAPALLAEHGFESFALVTTERAQAAVPGLAERAGAVLRVPPGRVDELAAELRPELPESAPCVALGGGRVVDTAKALAALSGVGCAAIPTTLSGAEMTAFHRLPPGSEGVKPVRPALVVADPELMASAPLTRLAASAMNALAHAMEGLYAPGRSPVTDLAALRAAALLAAGVTADPPDPEALALGAVLAGYVSGSTGMAVHHALCQTIVRQAGTPHAETNAVMLPHSARLMMGRAPGALADLAAAVGDNAGDPEAAPADLSRLAARSGHTRLATLGVEEDVLPDVAQAVVRHPLTGNTPDPPGRDELLDVLRDAL
jgi:alcohol dehydrogenase class IV